MIRLAALVVCLAALLGGCGDGVTARRLAEAGKASDEWLTHGRTYGEQRYSPLDQIRADNVDRLGLAWEASLESSDFGVEATPLVADGRLYVTSTWSRVFAFDAVTGKRLWAFDPEVPREWLRQGCCKAVNRGVALWKDKVYVGAFDGRLIALDAKTGKPVWSADTTDRKPLYTITGAPRVVKGKVIIGNGGGDFGTRGYISAYDAETGALAWRFFIVPRKPGAPQEHPELEAAVKTWDPDRDWTIGGGGNAWDSFSYDPELDLLYVGTGNAGPYDPRRRNPGGGDGLFVSSILALRPDTGRLVWNYQTTPGDQWDFTATANMVLADIEVGGKPAQVGQACRPGRVDDRHPGACGPQPFYATHGVGEGQRRTAQGVVNLGRAIQADRHDVRPRGQLLRLAFTHQAAVGDDIDPQADAARQVDLLEQPRIHQRFATGQAEHPVPLVERRGEKLGQPVERQPTLLARARRGIAVRAGQIAVARHMQLEDPLGRHQPTRRATCICTLNRSTPP